MTLDDIFKTNTLGLGQGGAPTYDLNTPLGQALMGMTLGAGGAGRMDQGISAFLGPLYQPSQNRTSSGAMDQQLYDQDYTNSKYMTNLGNQLGYQNPAAQQALLAPQKMGWDVINGYGNTPINSPVDQQNRYEAMQNYQAGLNDYLKDYSRISGMSSGWDGSNNNARSSASTLYRNDNNVFTPVSTPQNYTAREHGNWFQENPEFVSALSVMLPAVGGWAGLANMAGAGLSGTGAAAANAAGGAAMGAATGGTNGALTGLAGSLGGYLGGQAAGSTLGSQAAGFGSTLGSQLGKTLAQQNLPAQQGINPGYYGGASFGPQGFSQTGNGQYTDTAFLNNQMNRF